MFLGLVLVWGMVGWCVEASPLGYCSRQGGI